MENVAMARLNQAAANGQIVSQGAMIVDLVEAV